MKKRRFLLWIVGLLLAPLLTIYGQDKLPLKLIQRIPMPNVKGRLDHFGVDLEGRRLFVAALGDDQNTVEVRHPPRSGWLDELGRLKDGRSAGLGVARCAPYWLVQNCPAAPSAVSCSRMYVRTCSSSNPTVDTA